MLWVVRERNAWSQSCVSSWNISTLISNVRRGFIFGTFQGLCHWESMADYCAHRVRGERVEGGPNISYLICNPFSLSFFLSGRFWWLCVPNWYSKNAKHTSMKINIHQMNYSKTKKWTGSGYKSGLREEAHKNDGIKFKVFLFTFPSRWTSLLPHESWMFSNSANGIWFFIMILTQFP